MADFKSTISDLEKGNMKFYKVFWWGLLITWICSIGVNFLLPQGIIQVSLSIGLLYTWLMLLWRNKKNVQNKLMPYLAFAFIIGMNILGFLLLINL